MADESPGKALREDVQAKQQALDEAKAALDKYEADKAAAANADAAEDAIGAASFFVWRRLVAPARAVIAAERERPPEEEGKR